MPGEIPEIPAGTSRTDGTLRRVGASCHRQEDRNVVPTSLNHMKAPEIKKVLLWWYRQ